MKRRNQQVVFVVTLLALALAPMALRSQTNSLIVPREQANVFGNRIGVLFSAGKFRQFYGAAEFANLPTEVIAITAMSFRWDEEYNREIDDVISHVSFGMGVSTAPQSRFNESVVPVFSMENVRVVGQEIRPPSQFDVHFLLQRPFIYDRRAGRLILEGSVSGETLAEVDAEFTWDRGSVIIYNQAGGGLGGFPHVMVTQFFYKIVPFINSIRRSTDSLTIGFTVATGAKYQLESSLSVNGPYEPEPNAELIQISPERKEAVVPISTKERFFRVRTE